MSKYEALVPGVGWVPIVGDPTAMLSDPCAKKIGRRKWLTWAGVTVRLARRDQ